MKVLGVSGGTRGGGNDAMCKEGLLGAKESGADIEFVNLYDLEICACSGCVACVVSMFSGKGGKCVFKDDFDWLLDKMLDADAILFSIPIFEKCASGQFHNLMDRFGPRLDRGNNLAAAGITKEQNLTPPDPRILKDKVVSFMAVGGSDWCSGVESDFGIYAMTTAWKTIHREVFSWSQGIIMQDEKLKKAHQIGKELTEAAKDYESAAFQSEPGVCSHCNSRNFYLRRGKATCCICGLQGEIRFENGDYIFTYNEERVSHAHDMIEGKMAHCADIGKNIETLMVVKNTAEGKEKSKYYRSVITGVKPERK